MQLRRLESSPAGECAWNRAAPGTGLRQAGFTLLEVILAVGIATGILVVVMVFYQQSAELRTRLLLEAERLSAIRLIMERLSADLRGAYQDANSAEGLTGDSTSLTFVKAELPPASAWAGGAGGRAAVAYTDLKRVSYALGSTGEGTNLVATGLIRTEQSLVKPREITVDRRTARVPLLAEEKAPAPPEPATDAVKFVRFRYWDGAAWVESWSDPALPRGVEVTFGTEPLSAAEDLADYAGDLYRRVIALPAHGAGAGDASWSEWLDELPSASEENP